MNDLTIGMAAIRHAMEELPAGAAWPAGQLPSRSEIFTPRSHRNVLDVSRSLVVGNRGVGKTFWSHALSSADGRRLAAAAYRLPTLNDLEAVFGFRGTISDELAPSPSVISKALAGGADPLTMWQAVLLRAYRDENSVDLPSDLTALTSWFMENPEVGERRIRAADAARSSSGKPLLVMFDALDTLASDWTEIRLRTEGLLRLAVLAKGLAATRVKIFMRPDQLADAQLFRFPDASKLRAERVELEWGHRDLYALMTFHLWKSPETRETLTEIVGSERPLFETQDDHFSPAWIQGEEIQRHMFDRIAGPWMGRDKKRGATYSWLVQHLADARGETTPRGFLTALRAAAQAGPSTTDLAIDFKGIQQGVAEASENRVDDLRQDYWWIDFIKGPLNGRETPLEREALLELWRDAGTADRVRSAADGRGLLPIFMSLRELGGTFPQELAHVFANDESALLESLKLIGVVEIRPNGKVNVPDIFRVAFQMKRRGGVPPRRLNMSEH